MNKHSAAAALCSRSPASPHLPTPAFLYSPTRCPHTFLHVPSCPAPPIHTNQFLCPKSTVQLLSSPYILWHIVDFCCRWCLLPCMLSICQVIHPSDCKFSSFKWNCIRLSLCSCIRGPLLHTHRDIVENISIACCIVPCILYNPGCSRFVSFRQCP